MPEYSTQALAGLAESVATRASEALTHVSEEDLTDSLEVVCFNLGAVLGNLAKELPSSRQQCEEFLARQGPVSEVCGSPLVSSADEVWAVVSVITQALFDAQTALAEVTREEIEEIAEAALAAAQVAVAATQVAAAKLRIQANRDAKAEARASTVMIEELSTVTQNAEGVFCKELSTTGGPTVCAAGRNHFAVSTESCNVVFLRPRRYMWKPLWPKLRFWVAKSAPLKLPRMELLALFLLLWPFVVAFSFFTFWIAMMVLPLVLTADYVVQRLYTVCGAQIEDFLEGSYHLFRLFYVTARLTTKRTLRVVRVRLRNTMGGKSFGDTCWDALSRPCSSFTLLVRFATRLVLRTPSAAMGGWRGLKASFLGVKRLVRQMRQPSGG